MNYLAPEYYTHFKCKCGECRHSCCDGWPIRISTKEYYNLLGVSCSDKLRSRLDCALKVCNKPSQGSYAQIATDWHGICMLHREDGLCALQAELGESSLPEVCKLYPRNTKRISEVNECSCSNSCEEVIELLINMKEPLRFEEISLSQVPGFKLDLPSYKLENCMKTIKIIQNRSHSFPERFILLGNFLYGTDNLIKVPDQFIWAISFLHIMNRQFEDSNSICDYSKEIQSYYGIEGKDELSSNDIHMIVDRYTSASKHLDVILPDWQLLFEQLIVNHMFYNTFPYIDHLEKETDSYLSLITTYSLLRFNLLGYMSDKIDMEKMVDFLAAMFRLIEHSNYKNIAVNLLKHEILSENECLPQLIYL